KTFRAREAKPSQVPSWSRDSARDRGLKRCQRPLPPCSPSLVPPGQDRDLPEPSIASIPTPSPVKRTRANFSLRRSPPAAAESADRDHPVDRATGAGGDLRLDHHLVLPVAERVAQLLERDHLHVLANRPLGDGLEAFARGLLVQAMDDSRLGGDEEAALG